MRKETITLDDSDESNSIEIIHDQFRDLMDEEEAVLKIDYSTLI